VHKPSEGYRHARTRYILRKGHKEQTAAVGRAGNCIHVTILISTAGRGGVCCATANRLSLFINSLAASFRSFFFVYRSQG
jgi:hypothetical protein